MRWAQYWELFTDRAPNSGKALEKAKLITIWVWAHIVLEIFCMSYFVEEFKTIILGKKAKFLSMISDVVAALPFKNIMPSRHCLLT